MDVTSLVLSLAAIGIAVGAMMYARQQAQATDRQAAAAEETLGIERERRREETQRRENAERALREADAAKVTADVRIRTYPPQANGSFRIDVINLGPASAHEVNVILGNALDGKTPPPLLPGEETHMVELVSGLWFPVRFSSVAEASQRFEVTVEWTDGRGPQSQTRVIFDEGS